MPKKSDKTFKSHGFSVTPVKSHGKTRYSVDLGKHPEKKGRYRKLARTKAEAQTIARNHRKLLDQEGEGAFNLTEEERIDAAKALALLKGSCTLEEAAKQYIQQSRNASQIRISFDEISAQYLEWMESTPVTLTRKSGGYRPASIRDARSQLALPRKGFAKHEAADISTKLWQTYLSSLPANPRQKKKHQKRAKLFV